MLCQDLWWGPHPIERKLKNFENETNAKITFIHLHTSQIIPILDKRWVVDHTHALSDNMAPSNIFDTGVTSQNVVQRIVTESMLELLLVGITTW